jgi:norsolorinic acid ketoreductase
VILVKVESTSDTDAKHAISSLSSQKINHIDTVIANAGMYKLAAFQKVADMKTSDLIEHVDVNAAGVVRLFQASLPLLQKSKKPIFMVVSSGAGSIAGMENLRFNVSAYGASKATVNFLIRCIHFEQPELIAFAVSPG